MCVVGTALDCCTSHSCMCVVYWLGLLYVTLMHVCHVYWLGLLYVTLMHVCHAYWLGLLYITLMHVCCVYWLGLLYVTFMHVCHVYCLKAILLYVTLMHVCRGYCLRLLYVTLMHVCRVYWLGLHALYMYMCIYWLPFVSTVWLPTTQGYQKVPETPLASCQVLKDEVEVWMDVQVGLLHTFRTK